MKIGFVSIMGSAPWGGSEELWSQTASRLVQRGVEVSANVVGWPTTPPKIQALIDAGCKVTFRPRPTRLSNKIIRKVMGDRVFTWLDQVKPDFVVVAQGGNFDGYAWMNACVRRGIPYASIAQSANPMFDLGARLSAARTAYAGAKVAFFASRGNMELTAKQLGQPLPNGEVMRNPISVSRDIEVPWPTAEGFKLACPGRLDIYQKGQDLVVDVLCEQKWRDRPLSVTLFGEGEDGPLLEERIKERDMHNVTFGGFVDGLSSIWKQHHGLILTSRYEGLPLVVVEAMMCNRMCVVTDVPGNAELMRDNISGFVAASTTPEAVDEALERAWAQRHRWEDIGKLAGEDVRRQMPVDPVGAFVEALERHVPALVGADHVI